MSNDNKTEHDRDHMGICRRCGNGLSAEQILDGEKPCTTKTETRKYKVGLLVETETPLMAKDILATIEEALLGVGVRPSYATAEQYQPKKPSFTTDEETNDGPQ